MPHSVREQRRAILVIDAVVVVQLVPCLLVPLLGPHEQRVQRCILHGASSSVASTLHAPIVQHGEGPCKPRAGARNKRNGYSYYHGYRVRPSARRPRRSARATALRSA